MTTPEWASANIDHVARAQLSLGLGHAGGVGERKSLVMQPAEPGAQRRRRSVVGVLAGRPPQRSSRGTRRWPEPAAPGSQPDTHPKTHTPSVLSLFPMPSILCNRAYIVQPSPKNRTQLLSASLMIFQILYLQALLGPSPNIIIYPKRSCSIKTPVNKLSSTHC